MPFVLTSHGANVRHLAFRAAPYEWPPHLNTASPATGPNSGVACDVLQRRDQRLNGSSVCGGALAVLWMPTRNRSYACVAGPFAVRPRTQRMHNTRHQVTLRATWPRGHYLRGLTR